MLKRIARGGGVLVAPWLYGMGRLVKSPALLSSALRVDPQFIRGNQDRLRAQGRSIQTVGQLMTAIELITSTTPNADSKIKEMFSGSESQLLQDVAGLLAHDCKRDGYFVEVGVGNGKDISNTYLMETQYGWKGLLVEPSHGFHALIKECRKAGLETRAAASIGGQQVRFEEYPEAGEFSKLASVEGSSPDKRSTKQYDVETATLDTILEENGAPAQIDYMSIDTEGTELDILKGLDFNKYTVGFFTIEHNFRPGNLEDLKAVLEPHGYRQVLAQASQFDAWFIHSSVKSSYIS